MFINIFFCKNGFKNIILPCKMQKQIVLNANQLFNN